MPSLSISAPSRHNEVNSSASFDSDEEMLPFCCGETVVPSTASFDEVHIQESSSPQTSIIRPKNELEFLISLQKPRGFWDCDVFQLLHTFNPLSVDNIQICATVYALAYMEIKFPSRRDEWELVARKAEAWLSHQTLPDQIDLGKLKKEASDYIINWSIWI